MIKALKFDTALRNSEALLRGKKKKSVDDLVIIIIDNNSEDLMLTSTKLKNTDWEVRTYNKIFQLNHLNDVDFILIDYNLNNGYNGDILGNYLQRHDRKFAYITGSDQQVKAKHPDHLCFSKNITSQELIKVIRDNI